MGGAAADSVMPGAIQRSCVMACEPSCGRPASNPVLVHCVDDHPVVSQGLAAACCRQGDVLVVSTSESASECLESDLSEVDVVIVDLAMPGVGGLELAPVLIERGMTCVALSLNDDAPTIQTALDVGFRGFASKRSSPEAIASVVVRAAAGELAIDETSQKALVGAMLVRYSAERSVSEQPSLTAREIEVLEAMAAGLTNREIAQKLLVSEGTVRKVVSRVLEKLGTRDRAAAVATALREGLID